MLQTQINSDSINHELIKNLEHNMQLSQAKSIFIYSELEEEGVTTFIDTTIPALSQIYNKKTLVFDMSRKNIDCMDFMERLDGPKDGFIEKTNISNIDYLELKSLTFLKGLSREERIIKANSFYNELVNLYDVVFIKNSAKKLIPPFKLDGAVLIKSKKSDSLKETSLTNKLKDRNIPLLGLVYNEGL